MKSSKLLEILKTFSASEWRRFEAFVKSPYFNKDDSLLQLAQLLRKEAPDFRADRIDKDRLWELVHPGQPGTVKDIKYWMNGLLKLAEQFLGQQTYESGNTLPEYHILEACATRNLPKHYRNRLKKARSIQDSWPYRNENYHYGQYLISGIEARYFHQQQLRTHDQSLQETVNHLDNYYLITKLRLTCELVNRQNILSQAYDLRLVDELKGYLESRRFGEVPAIAIYSEILNILTSETPVDHFVRLQDLMGDHLHLFPDIEKREIYSIAQNHCIQMIRKGEPGYMGKLFRLYQDGLRAGIFLEQGQFSPWKFKNIVSAGLRLGHFTWVEEFLQHYGTFLPEDFRESALLYNLAHLHYHRGEYSQALKLLNRVEFNDVFYSLDTRMIMARIFFEQGEYEPLDSLISAFKAFLRRNKLVSETNKKAYLNFIRALQKLVRLREGKAQAGELIGEFRSVKPLTDEDWLVRMAEKWA